MQNLFFKVHLSLRSKAFLYMMTNFQDFQMFKISLFWLIKKGLNFIQKQTNMQNNQKQLNELLKLEQRNELSSEQEDDKSTYQQPVSRGDFRKPIKNPFSDKSDSSDSDLQNTGGQRNVNPFPPKQPKTKSVLQQAQQSMKWNKQQQNEIQVLSKLQGQGMKDKKIRQLASKYKTLNIAYEKEKTMRRNLENQLNSQLKINQQSRNKSMQKENTIRTLDKSQVKDAKCTNPSCSQNQKKIMEFRLQSQNIKTELNKAHRVIARQIGQNFNVDQVLNQENAWKGRQQKIEKLKGRVKQLEQRLANNGVDVSHMSGFTQLTTATKTNNNFSMTRTSTMAENKRKQFDNLKIQVDALKSQNDLLQGKVKSLASRKLNLQTEIKELKSEYEKKKQILIEKSENDDKFINLLKNQNEKLKKQERVVTKVVYKDQKDNDQVNSLKKEIQKLRNQLNRASQKLAKQKQQKCLDKVDLNIVQDERIQIKFPPSQKKRSSVQKPARKSSSQIQAASQSPVYKVERQVSAQRKKQLENQYLKGNKYLKKLSADEQMSIYQNWKSGKKIQ